MAYNDDDVRGEMEEDIAGKPGGVFAESEEDGDEPVTGIGETEEEAYE